jgi:hypothetical protein
LEVQVDGLERERLADPPDRLAKPRAIAVQLAETSLELPQHLAELCSERRELVVAPGGDRRGKSPLPSLWAASRKRPSWLWSAHEASTENASASRRNARTKIAATTRRVPSGDAIAASTRTR